MTKSIIWNNCKKSYNFNRKIYTLNIKRLLYYHHKIFKIHKKIIKYMNKNHTYCFLFLYYL